MFINALGTAIAAASLLGSVEPSQSDTSMQAVEQRAAVNTFYGPTGLMLVPTAFVTPANQVSFGASFGSEMRGPSANWGATPGIEIGGAFIDREGADNKAIANAKVTIVPQNFDWFQIGIGVIDAVDAINTTVYVVGSATWKPPNWNLGSELGGRPVGLILHAGAGTGLFDEQFIAGAELILGDNLSIIGEWDSDNVNGALRYVHESSFRIQLGILQRHLYLGATFGFSY